MSKVQNISVISFLSFCIIVGSLVFSRGFLLNRQTIQERSGPCSNTPRSILVTARSLTNNLSVSNGKDGSSEHREPSKGSLSSASSWCNSPAPFSKMILVLVDALRFDFVQRMNFLSRITGRKTSSQYQDVVNNGTTSCLFKFVADPPTTTMQRLKALMTGTMPTFIDASANFNSYEIEEDSLVYQLEAAGKRIAFLGDDTWLSLFPKKYFKSPFVEAHPSFNAWDLDTVDRAVNRTLRKVLLEAHKDEWDILIAHLLGVDHCGHRYGPEHPEMVRKLNEADAIVEHVYNSMSNDTLLVIFGDHGMTSTGDHGGDSKDETESAVIFLSKQFKRNKQFSPPFQCSKQLSISQIDLVPTIAPLLGIPIPYSNIGQIIPEFLVNKTYSDAVAANVAQVHKYMQHFSIMLSEEGSATSDGNSTEGGTLIEQYQRIEEAFVDYQSSRNSATRARLHMLSQLYLKQVKAVAVSAWTQFNVLMIYTGVAITFLAVLSLSVYLTSVPRLVNYNTEHEYSVLSWLWPSLSHWSVLCTFVSHSAASSGLLGIIVSTLSGISVFLLILLFKICRAAIKLRRNRCNSKESSGNQFCEYPDISEIASIVLYIFTCLVVFSNSFVINEAYVVGSTLILVVLIRILCSSKSTEHELGINFDSDLQRPINEDNPLDSSVVKKTFRCSWSCFFVLAAIVRTSSTFFRCREEQVTCNEEYLLHKQLSSLPEDWLVHKYLRYGIALLTLAVFVVSFRHWMIYRRCTFSRKPRAVIARFIPSLLVVLLGVFWALQGLPYISSNASKVRMLMNHLPLVYQIVTVSSLICVWLKPICCIGHIRSLSYMNSFTKISKRNDFAVNFKSPSNYSNQRYESSKCESFPSNLKNSLSTLSINGVKKTNGYNGTIPSFQGHNSLNIYSLPDAKKSEQLRASVENLPQGAAAFNNCLSDDTYSSCFLTFGVLLTLLLIQVTSTGIAPAITLAAYAIVCLVGIYRATSNKNVGSWSSAVAWTLSSQYFFYATGHQPIFSAIPWDSAFVGSGDGLSSVSVSWIPWARAGLAVIGNLHVSQIIFSFALPLLVYWRVGKGKHESLMGRSERRKAYILCGKYLALHGLKLLMCMSCAAWHRRHLMVWKIFAPKFIFEAVSFIVTSSAVLLCIVFISRIHYFHQNALTRFSQRSI